MDTPLTWQTAVRQGDKNIYTWTNPSSPSKSEWAAIIHYDKTSDFLIIVAPTLPLTARHVNLVVRNLPATLPLPYLPVQGVMFTRFAQNLRHQSGRFILPAATVLLFVLVGWSYRQQTPLLETPDEPAHFEIANYIAQYGTLPPRPEITRSGPAPTVSADEPFYYAPPLYYLLASLLVRQADAADFAQAVIPNPNFDRGVGVNLGLSPENKNMYVHTAVQNPPNLANWATSMWRVRLLSLGLGMVTLAGCFALAQQVWPKKWRWQMTAVALVLFNPTFLYLSNGVTNDALLIALSTWSFVLMGSLLQHGDTKIGWREWVLAVLLGCAILTKQTGFILLPSALLVMVYKARQQQWSRHRLLAVLAMGIVVITAVGGWWYLVNGIQQGDPLALESHNALPPVENLTGRLLFVVQQSWGAFKSYWAAFGWATIFVQPIWLVLFVGLTGLGLTGWFFNRDAPSTKLSQLLWLAALLNSGLMLIWLWRTAAPYGRLLFPTIAPISCLLVLGWQRWLTQLRLPDGVAQFGFILPLATLAMLAPTRYLQPAFAPVVAAPSDVADYLPLNATFGESYLLLGYTIDTDPIETGDTVTLTLFWQLTQPVASPNLIETVIQVAPLDPEAQIAAISRLLGTPQYPAPYWQPDEIIVQEYPIKIAPGSPAPSLYWFDVILLDEETQARLPVVWQDQLPTNDLLRVGPVPIVGEDTAVPQPATNTDYNFGQQIQLNGYTITPATNDSGLEVALFWEALAQPTVDWTVFVHLVDQNGELAAQGDGLPRQGNFPTIWWTPEIIILDTHLLAGEIGCDALNEYTVVVGFYDPITANRLPVNDTAGQPMPNGAVELQPACSDKNP